MAQAYMYTIGLFFLAYTYKFNRQLLRIEWKPLGIWGLFLIVNAAVKYWMFQSPDVREAMNLSVISQLPWYYMVLAGYEEAFFTLPVYYAMIYTENKYFRATLMASMAGVFALGHVYQGVLAAVPTFIYMFIVAPRFMRKYGFGNMVIGHIAFDLSMWVVIQSVV